MDPQGYMPPPPVYAPQALAPPPGPMWAPPPPPPPELQQQPTKRTRTGAVVAASLLALLIIARVVYAVHLGHVAQNTPAVAKASTSSSSSAPAASATDPSDRPWSPREIAVERHDRFGVAATRHTTNLLQQHIGPGRIVKSFKVMDDGVQSGIVVTPDRYDIVYSDMPDDGVTGAIAEVATQTSGRAIAFDEINPAVPGRLLRIAQQRGYVWNPDDEILTMILQERPQHDGTLVWGFHALKGGTSLNFFTDADGKNPKADPAQVPAAKTAG